MKRRSFLAAAFSIGLPIAFASLGGCSFSLRDFLHKDIRLRTAAGPDAKEADDSSPQNELEVAEGVQYGFWFNSESCVGCFSCVESCNEKNGLVEDAPPRRWLIEYTFENGDQRVVSLSCMHCMEPGCMKACPAGAICKTSEGIVSVDKGRCIGCRYCHQACPFAVPRYTKEGMDKCDCCLGAGLDAGSTPHCANGCPTKALRYGDLRTLRRMDGCPDYPLEAPTNPSFFLS